MLRNDVVLRRNRRYFLNHNQASDINISLQSRPTRRKGQLIFTTPKANVVVRSLPRERVRVDELSFRCPASATCPVTRPSRRHSQAVLCNSMKIRLVIKIDMVMTRGCRVRSKSQSDKDIPPYPVSRKRACRQAKNLLEARDQDKVRLI